MSLKAFAKRLYEEYENDAVADSAAALSYYFVFALFPFLFFLATLTAFVPYIRQSIDTILAARARRSCPNRRSALVETHLRELVENPRPRLLTFGLLATLYTASRGVDALRKTLNLAYDVKESRPWWKTEAVAFGMTIGGAVLTLVAIAALTAGGSAGFWLAEKIGVAKEYVFVWSWLRWPVTALIIMLCAALAYYVLPDVKQKFKFITPGSVIGTVVWLLGTWGFSVYAGELRQLQRHLRIDRRRDRPADVVLHHRVHLPDGRRDERDHRGTRRPKANGAARARPARRRRPRSERPSAMPVGAADSAARGGPRKGRYSAGGTRTPMKSAKSFSTLAPTTVDRVGDRRRPGGDRFGWCSIRSPPISRARRCARPRGFAAIFTACT